MSERRCRRVSEQESEESPELSLLLKAIDLLEEPIPDPPDHFCRFLRHAAEDLDDHMFDDPMVEAYMGGTRDAQRRLISRLWGLWKRSLPPKDDSPETTA